MTRRVVLAVGAVLALAFVALDTAPFASRSLDRGQVVGRDFALFRGAGELALRGEFDAVWDGARVARAAPGPGGVAPRAFTYFAYPPPMLLVCVPFARLPYGVALGVWLAGGAALLVVAAGGSARGRCCSRRRCCCISTSGRAGCW